MAPTDGITMNRYRLLADAKAKALSMVEGYAPPEAPTFLLPGATARSGLNMAVAGFARLGKATPHDVVVSDEVAGVLSGGDTDVTTPVTEDRLYELEREGFMRLVRNPGSLARVEHMLETGKPLRN